nr:hypothetical protein [Micromonospora sp. DSM 115978]
RTYQFSASLGLVLAEPVKTTTEKPVTADSLLLDADIAMYAAKRQHRGDGLVVRRAGLSATDRIAVTPRDSDRPAAEPR